MARIISVAIKSDAQGEQARLMTIFPRLGYDDSKKVWAGQIFSDVKINCGEYGSGAVIFVVCPQKGESESAFIARIQQKYAALNEKLNDNNPNKVPVVVVLDKADLLAPEVAARLQAHLKHMLVQDDVVFSLNTRPLPYAQTEEILLKAARLAIHAYRYYIISQENMALKVLGAIAGLFIETLSDIIRLNPVADFFKSIRDDYRGSSTILTFLFKAALSLLLSPLSLLAYFLMPFSAIYNTYKGWKNGPAEVIDKSIDFVNRRLVIAGAFISALMITAALCVIFPPAGLAVFIPTIIAGVGLTGWSTTWLAIFAAAAVYGITASLYAIGSNLYDYVTTSHGPLPTLSAEPIQFITASSNAAGQMTSAPSAPGVQPKSETGESIFPTSTAVLSPALAATGAGAAVVDEAQQRLLQPQ